MGGWGGGGEKNKNIKVYQSARPVSLCQDLGRRPRLVSDCAASQSAALLAANRLDLTNCGRLGVPSLALSHSRGAGAGYWPATQYMAQLEKKKKKSAHEYKALLLILFKIYFRSATWVSALCLIESLSPFLSGARQANWGLVVKPHSPLRRVPENSVEIDELSN